MTRPAWLIDLERDGVAVVPGCVPPEHCAEFREAALKWAESFPHGFKRDDKSTWNADCLPFANHGGLYTRYSVNHEDFVWKIRTQPGVIDAFAQIWGTDDLISSFDGMNFSLPVNENGRKDLKPTQPWPHIDQNVRRIGKFELYQGIVNLGLCGPEDGGLVVMKGSQALHEKYFEATGGWKEKQDAGPARNSYLFERSEMQWYLDHGCEILKVTCNPGDLILWDSRTMHWNASPTGDNARFATYVCMAPRKLASEADLKKKLEVFEARKGTTHWPHMNIIPVESSPNAQPKRPDGSVDPANRTRPFHEPQINETVMKLVGVRS